MSAPAALAEAGAAGLTVSAEDGRLHWRADAPGDEIAALTETEAVIRTRTGARQTYRRKPRDPLHAAERCLLWELG